MYYIIRLGSLGLYLPYCLSVNAISPTLFSFQRQHNEDIIFYFRKGNYPVRTFFCSYSVLLAVILLIAVRCRHADLTISI
ncbi:hypothetical protein BDV36DRAFT_242725 [Aspergillus pseudocaelatus]|uniref:Uncharacterized protein n=1 Tax=Aspergillus pseudocaelatus TaxID=1825620 RepID=A0ABQ6X2G1_9EURO|nr:hypothetical protein BDV36DRAFT_242725 [Aspergillus pseudocaelatus]